MDSFDVILVGGGLANGLIADRLAVARRNLSVLVLEAGEQLGGDHTWSYHKCDVTPEQDLWLKSMSCAAWTSQEVRFPSYQRSISTGYRTIISRGLHNRVIGHRHLEFGFGTRVQDVEEDKVTLRGGRQVHGKCIIDGRGMPPSASLRIGYQKFFGLECEMSEPHGLTSPILMDTIIEQNDGYRFMYCLPYSPTQMLIEDTYYSDSPELNKAAIERDVHVYAQGNGWEISSIRREESGVLPVVLGGCQEMIWPNDENVARSGTRAGFFHQTTGYSLPFAAQVATGLAQIEDLNSQNAATYLRCKAQKIWKKQGYFRLLNRLLFLASQNNNERRQIFERFYRLPKPLIERFYASDLNASDKFRILLGRPPVAIHRAIAAIPPGAAAAREINPSFCSNKDNP